MLISPCSRVSYNNPCKAPGCCQSLTHAAILVNFVHCSQRRGRWQSYGSNSHFHPTALASRCFRWRTSESLLRQMTEPQKGPCQTQSTVIILWTIHHFLARMPWRSFNPSNRKPLLNQLALAFVWFCLFAAGVGHQHSRVPCTLQQASITLKSFQLPTPAWAAHANYACCTSE